MDAQKEKTHIDKIGYFLNYILKNLRQHYEQKKDWKIRLDSLFLGDTSIESLSLLFEFFWKLSGWKQDEVTIIIIQSQGGSSQYMLEIKTNKLKNFKEISNYIQDEDHRIIYIDLDTLSPIAEKGTMYLLLSLLQCKGIKISKGNFIWKTLGETINVSPKGLELIIRWLFPLSGLGIILQQEEQVLPFIFYGGTPTKINIKRNNTIESIGLRRFTQFFRASNKLGFVLSLNIEYMSKFLKGEMGFLDILSIYGKGWLISILLEIDDFIFHFPELIKFLPGENIRKSCNLDRKNIFELIQGYIENALKYIKKQSLYLTFKDLNDSLCLEINKNGIFETVYSENIPKENLFVLDMEIITTLLSWVNDTSLHLISNFIESIIPAEVSEKIQREEVLLKITLQNIKGDDFDLLISGGEHNLPEKSWQGDFNICLMEASNKEVIYNESLPETPLLITEEEKGYRVFFPINSSLGGKSLYVEHIKSEKIYQGMSKLVSETSILSKIMPGLRTNILFGSIKEKTQFAIQNQNYTIKNGNLLWSNTTGSIIKHHGLVKYITHLWLNNKELHFHNFGFSNPNKNVPKWWNSFVQSTEQVKATITKDSTEVSEVKISEISINDNEIKLPKKFALEKKGEKEDTLKKFWILNAWAIPFDRRGNFLIRARAIAISKKSSGFALLEFPCHISGIITKSNYLPLTIEKQKKDILFQYRNICICKVENAKYLSILKPGLRWSWHYFWRHVIKHSEDE